MKLKPGVKFGSKDQAMAFALVVVNSIFTKYGYDCVITSVNDSVHGTGSLHFSDAAMDIRTKHLPDKATKEKIVNEIRDSLPDAYDVILEHLGADNEHCHLEYQPK